MRAAHRAILPATVASVRLTLGSGAPFDLPARGRVQDRLTSPRVVLDGGRAVRPRRVPLAGQDAWVAFLPDAAVRGLRSGDRHAPLALPPASAQCGYAVERRF